MHAQLSYFDGPRSAELVAASEFAGRNRLIPALTQDPQCRAAHRGTFILRGPDGTEVVLVLVGDAAALDRGGDVIRATELLPGEDPALLPGPDRVARYEVVAAYDADYELFAR